MYLPVTEEELIKAELEAKKNCIYMIKIHTDRSINHRIIVHPKDKEHFKNLGYAEILKEGYDPQMGHEIIHHYIHLKEEFINYKLKFKEKFIHFLRKLFRSKTLLLK